MWLHGKVTCPTLLHGNSIPQEVVFDSFLLINVLTGEPFTQEEMEEMLSAAVDPDKGIIFYKDFVSMMVVEDA